MRKNYIILVHKNPNQILHLVKKLDGSESCFYIHIDININAKPFEIALSELPNIKFIKNRESGTWGDLGIVKATVNAMKEIVKAEEKGYCILLSGQDYPIKSIDLINTYFTENNGYDFIDVSPIKEVFPTEWNIRLNFYKYNLSNERGKYIWFSSKMDHSFLSTNFIKNIIKIMLFKRDINFIKEIIANFNKKRIIPFDMIPYAGGQWWSLTFETTSKIIDFIDKNPALYEYNKYSLLPDETFFQTIIKHLSLKDSTIKIKDSTTYANWSRKNCDLPVTFNDTDFNELTSLPINKLFARKFDFDYNQEIINLLDQI